MEPIERKHQHVHTKTVETKESEEILRVMEALHDLRLATIRGDLEAVKTTLAKGITVNQTLKGGWTALMFACSMGHPAIVQYLLQQGANANFHKELFTPLMATCASTQEDEDRLVQCVDLLLQHKVNVNVVERHHITALMFAAKEGHAKVVARLLAPSCNCQIDAKDSQGWTALFWAVNKGRRAVVEVLMARGANTAVQDRCGQTVVDMARNKSLSHVLNILTKKHTEPPYSCPDTPLWNSPDQKSKYMFGKGANTMLQALLKELSSSVINNNSRCTGLLNSLELDNNNVEVLKPHEQVISRIANSVNGCLHNSILSANKYSQNPLTKQTKPMEMSWKNIPYSAVEAREVLRHMVRHVEGLYASLSYVRLHMQGNPPAALLEDRHAHTADISALADQLLHSSRLLYDEVHFFHQYAKQLEESDCVVAADLVIERKSDRGSRYAKLASSCVIAAAVIVLLFNSRLFSK